MISKEQFLELKHLKSLGVPTTTICKKIGISVPSANKWLRMDEDAFETYLRNNTPYLEQYRAFILSILKICPQTPATNIMYRIKDQFPDFDYKKNTFFRYVKTLREQTGYIKPENRPTSFREETPPGYEAQVDFGQFKMKDMYDRNLWVYFFCMVLSYSRMRFVYFSREPFRTQTAIDAHKYAFRYFGGRTQTILYDQDKVFVVSEHYGNVILVPAFEDFVCQAGFSVILCRKSDPQTKGKVESFVRYVKEGFLQGRLYTGIDSLNSAALEWLDKECNGTIHERTRKAPRELFREESKHLEKVQLEDEQNIVVIGKCDTGKTTLAAHIGQMALVRREAVYYCNIEEFLRVIKNKDSSRKTEKIYRYMLDCSVIIIDDVMYANITPENLPVFYRAVSFLNEARSLIIITNRELSGWVSAAEDTHLMQTLVDRITANSQIIRLG